MKKLISPILALLASSAVLAQAPQGFTITVVNNGTVTKNAEKYQQQVKTIFPQLANITFAKKGAAGYTVEILIDSPEIVNVVNVPESIAPVTYSYSNTSNVANNNSNISEEKHLYNVSYVQNVIRIRLLDKSGTVISEKRSNDSPVFTEAYTHSFRIDPETRSYKDAGPAGTDGLFANDKHPRDFSYKPSVEVAIGRLIAL